MTATEPRNVPELFLERVGLTPEAQAFSYPTPGGGWGSLTWEETEARVRAVASGLRAIGFAAGDVGEGPPVLAAQAPDDVAIESVRSLRTSLQFSLVDAPTPVVAVTGPAPGVGKSFVTCNLAQVVAEAGKRVVVVDADMRRGHLHEALGGDRANGLSDVLAGVSPWEEVVRKSALPGVDFIATGQRPPNPSVLLEGERFGRLVRQLAKAYDLVLVDTPPILAVTDAALAAAQASVALCVLRAGRHPMREISTAIRRFAQGGVRIDGFVLNGVKLDRGLGVRNAYHYQYSYE